MKTEKKILNLNTDTINWMRRRVNGNMLSTILNKMVMNDSNIKKNQKSNHENLKNRNTIIFPTKINILKEQKDVIDPKYKNLKFKPEYFFNKSTMDNIYKLRNIFLEFDKDRSSKILYLKKKLWILMSSTKCLIKMIFIYLRGNWNIYFQRASTE